MTKLAADTLEWNDLSLILEIGRAESLSGAARALGQTHSTVFRRINAVEERTGVRFFDRFRSGYVPTDAGRMAMQAGIRVEAEVIALGREVLGRDGRLSGPIRVTCPESFADEHAPRIAADFVSRHPQIRIDVVPGQPAIDLERREAEVAIRATKAPPEATWGRKICDFRFAFYASADYAGAQDGAPFEALRFAVIDSVAGWFVPAIWPDRGAMEAQVVFFSRSTRSVLNAAAAGLGIAPLPAYAGDADARLVRVTDTWDAFDMTLWVLTHPDLRGTARVRALMAHLYEVLGGMTPLFAGETPRPGAVRLFDLPGQAPR